MSSNPITKILERLDCKPNGKNKYLARCPSHDDRSPSLAIEELEGGKVVLHCFAGCETYDIVTSIGLEMSDLFPDSTPTSRSGTKARDLATLRRAREKHDRGRKLDEIELKTVEAALTRLYR